MNRLDLLKQTDVSQASHFIIGLAKMFPNDSEALEQHLSKEITKEELHQINDAARKEGFSPIVFIP